MDAINFCLTSLRTSDEKIDIILHYYLSSQKNGTITLSEHESLAWVEKKDFEKYDFAEGDGNILSLL